jgi:hypothetical protein
MRHPIPWRRIRLVESEVQERFDVSAGLRDAVTNDETDSTRDRVRRTEIVLGPAAEE